LQKIYIIDAARLPVAKPAGIYKGIIPEQFTAYLAKSLLAKNDLDAQYINCLHLGCALGTGGNMARYVALEAGLPAAAASLTVDLQCASGLAAVATAAGYLQASGGLALAGGMESCTMAPIRQYQKNDPRFEPDAPYYTQASFAPDSFGNSRLLAAAQNLATQYHLQKADMQNFTCQSHRNLSKLYNLPWAAQHIIPYQNHNTDQAHRPKVTLAHLQAKQKPQTIDHTTAAHQNDGAALLLLATQSAVKKHGFRPQFELLAWAQAGCAPSSAPMAAIVATQKLLQQTKLSANNIQCFEINESFAATPLAFAQHFGLKPENINNFGGNLAYGHPFGASAAINTVQLMVQMKQSNSRLGIVAVAAAGGQGMAALLQYHSK
jgi:acetyl-CoA C-acetyltransferase